jgi:hypothetical protein
MKLARSGENDARKKGWEEGRGTFPQAPSLLDERVS